MSNKPNMKARNRVSSARPKPGSRPTTPPPTPLWKSPMVWVGALLGLALIVALAVSAVGGDDEPAESTGLESAPAEVLGAALVPFDTPDAAIGTQAPDIVASTVDGDRVSLTADGTARLYGFFAHWCPHCQAELPRTVAWLQNNELPDGVEIVAVSTSVDSSAPNYPPSAWFTREGWPATLLVDSPELALANGYGLTSFPYWVAVDGDGTVVARMAGEIGEAQLAALVDAITPASAASDTP